MEFTKCYFGIRTHNVAEHMQPYTFCKLSDIASLVDTHIGSRKELYVNGDNPGAIQIAHRSKCASRIALIISASTKPSPPDSSGDFAFVRQANLVAGPALARNETLNLR